MKLDKEIIKQLYAAGHDMPTIAKMLGCSKSGVHHHLAHGVKKYRTKKYRSDPVARRIHSFIRRRKKDFFRAANESRTFTAKDVIDKFGKNPVCYLTGKTLSWDIKGEIEFDHIIPASRGGAATLENLGICHSKANRAKSDMKIEEFLEFCKLILEHNGYKVSK